MKKYINWLLIPLAFIFSAGCNKLIEIKPSTTQVLDAEVYKDSALIKLALAGMYSKLAFSTAYTTNISVLAGYSADELDNATSTNYNDFKNNALLPSDIYSGDIWTSTYAVIYSANSIIDGVPKGSGVTDGFKNNAIAEARFIRAFCYFYLVNFYGDVPLILGLDVNQNIVAPRTTTLAVYQQIIADLTFARNNLPADYSISANQRTRANKWVAAALLSRVYLYTGDWTNAEAQASSIIGNTSLFSLSTNLNQVFAPTSKEAIWQFYNDANGYTAIARLILPNPITKVPGIVYTTQMVNAFEATDNRKTVWTATITYNGTPYIYPYKYKDLTNGNVEFNTVVRLAEQYLIRAEAYANLPGRLPDAAKDINAVRNRAGLGNTTASTQQDLLKAIEQERRVELNGEWGHRWFDLKRTNRVNTVIGALKPTWSQNAILYPIPTEALLGPGMKQNPGYN